MHDIYDPPPAPVAWDPPRPEPLVYTLGDITGLTALVAVLAIASRLAWSFDPTLALLVGLGGALVVAESWFTAVGYLHRQHAVSLRQRWGIFLAALIPWAVVLGVAAALMYGLFLVSDWLG